MSDNTQFTLKVKQGSEMWKTLQRLLESPATNAEVQEAAGTGDSKWIIGKLPKWFDNVALASQGKGEDRTHRAKYIEPVAPTIHLHQENGHKLIDVPTAVATQSATEDNKIVWGNKPEIPFPIKNFDKPAWYDEMEYMAVKKGRHISLEGPPSVGKDTAVIQLAAEHNKPLAVVGGDAGFRTVDLKGKIGMSSGTDVFSVADYATAAVMGWWCLVTEVNAADPDGIMYINRQLAAPHVVDFQGKSYPVHPNFRLFVTYNHGLVGTKPLPQSFKDRFFSIKVPFFTTSQLVSRLKAMRPDADFPEYIANFGTMMWKAHENGKMRFQITTRRLVDVMDLLDMSEINYRKAITMAVLGAIDSPPDYKAAQAVMADWLPTVETVTENFNNRS